MRTRISTARARDFVDICAVVEGFGLDMLASENIRLLRKIFEAKRVPIELIGAVSEYREFHRSDFESVKATVKSGVVLRDFDFYCDRVVALGNESLKALRNE